MGAAPSARALAIELARACEARKAADTRILQVSKITFITDYFVICTVQSERQSRAVTEEAAARAKKGGHRLLGVEGDKESSWAVADFGDVVLHVFTAEARRFYDIEAAWADAKNVHWASRSKRAPAKR